LTFQSFPFLPQERSDGRGNVELLKAWKDRGIITNFVRMDNAGEK